MNTAQESAEAAPREIVEHAEVVGTERLARSRLDSLVTSSIGGGEASPGGVTAMTVSGTTMTVLPTIDLKFVARASSSGVSDRLCFRHHQAL
jgi:hypothetical protein